MQRILIFLDGTWKSERGDSPVTNVVRLRELVDFERSGDADPPADSTDRRIRHRIYYDEGVGTGASRLGKILGGAFGSGLERNIREAYRFLSQAYEPGDEIYIFGFSRGAFTARSLAGYVGASGLLRAEHCSEPIEQAAWRYYRTAPKERYPADRAVLDAYAHPSGELRIKCLGVFDTVGALGIPITALNFINAYNLYRYRFHDTNLSSSVDYSFHAVSVDERRRPFRPAVWNRPLHNQFKAVEQVWFAGGHSDVGGGDVDARSSDPAQPLSSIPLDWMIKRVEAFSGLRFHDRSHWGLDPGAPQQDAYGRIYRVFGPMIRVINTIVPAGVADRNLATLPKHLSPIGEALHVSVLERLGRRVLTNGQETVYGPNNVVVLLEVIERTYAGSEGRDVPGSQEMKVADYSGRVLDPSEPDDAALVRRCIAAARRRLGQGGTAVPAAEEPAAT